jgi:hypothetical protein
MIIALVYNSIACRMSSVLKCTAAILMMHCAISTCIGPPIYIDTLTD